LSSFPKKALLEKCHLDYESDPFFAQQQLTTWWYRFDMDNWFSYERVSEAVGTFINHYPNSNMEIAFFRGFTNSGTVAEAVTPNDLVVSLNREELVVTIWGVSLYD